MIRMKQGDSSELRHLDEGGEVGVTYSIRVISSEPAPDGRVVRTVLFRRTSRGESIEMSAETDADNLLAKLPDFLDAAMDLSRSLWPAQRAISRLPSGFFPRFAEESRRLRWLTASGAGAEHEDLERRRVEREALIVRDVAWEAIRSVLPAERRREVDALVGFHETAADLAVSMEAIAAQIEAMLGDAEDAALLAACDVDAMYAAALRRHAVVVSGLSPAAEPGEEAGKGPRVLRLIGAAYRALRTDAFMALTRAEAGAADVG
jgi:hypothetical protein